jgi:hypothetical protein
MEGTMQDKPATVPAKATQGGKAPADRERRLRWPWAEASIWTDRMLAALESGVKGGCWFSLIDHQRWPNAFFADLGLFSLDRAQRAACQSMKVAH